MLNEQETLKHQILLKLGYHFVPEGNVLPVYRNEMFHRFLEPGYHYCSGWNERYDRLISTDPRLLSFREVEARSCDRISVTVDINLSYNFDPRRCRSQRVQSRMAGVMPGQIKHMLQVLISEAVCVVSGQYPEAWLVTGSNWPKLAREIRLRVQRTLIPYGILLTGSKSIIIARVVPPREIDRAREAARTRDIYTQSIYERSPQIARELHLQELARNSDRFNVNIWEENIKLRAQSDAIEDWLNQNPDLADARRNGRIRTIEGQFSN